MDSLHFKAAPSVTARHQNLRPESGWPTAPIFKPPFAKNTRGIYCLKNDINIYEDNILNMVADNLVNNYIKIIKNICIVPSDDIPKII